MHIAGGGPSALASGLLPNTLTTKRIDKVRYFDPQISDGDGVGIAGRLVEHGDLDLVRLVDDDLELFLPAIGLARVRPCTLSTLDLEGHKRIRHDAGRATTSENGSVVEFAGALDRYLEFTGQRFRAQVRLGVAVRGICSDIRCLYKVE